MSAAFEFAYGAPVSAAEARDRLTRHPSAVIHGLPFQEYGDFSTDPVTSSLVIATTDWQAVAAALPTYLQTILSENLTAEVTADCVRWVQVRPTQLAGIDGFNGTSYRTEHDDGRPVTGDDEGAIQVVCVELVTATPTDVVPGVSATAGTR
jgi:hypothetical protein